MVHNWLGRSLVGMQCSTTGRMEWSPWRSAKAGSRHIGRLTLQLALLSVAAIGIGCSAQQPLNPSTSVADTRPCAANLSVEGSFWTGRTFKSFQELPNVSKGDAFDRVVGAITAAGWQITNANKELGIVSGSQMVSFGNGKTVPLNAVVRTNGTGGARVELVFQTSGGLAVSLDSVREQFCKILQSAAG